jgi:hypothetical protein
MPSDDGYRSHTGICVVLNGDGIAARGDLALRGATIAGEVRLLGAHFGGDIDCTSATLAQPDGFALRLNRARIDGAFFLRQGASILGTLDLTATEIGAIGDEEACWPQRSICCSIVVGTAHSSVDQSMRRAGFAG